MWHPLPLCASLNANATRRRLTDAGSYTPSGRYTLVSTSRRPSEKLSEGFLPSWSILSLKTNPGSCCRILYLQEKQPSILCCAAEASFQELYQLALWKKKQGAGLESTFHVLARKSFWRSRRTSSLLNIQKRRSIELSVHVWAHKAGKVTFTCLTFAGPFSALTASTF